MQKGLYIYMDESLQRKQKLAQMLLDANEVRTQYIMEKLPARKVTAAEKQCAQLIASLIEEGIPYRYNKEEDTIVINIDDELISCKNDDIYDFLGEMYESIMKKTYEEITEKKPKDIENNIPQQNSAGQPVLPYTPIIIQTENKEEKKVSQPIQEYIPPKVYINEEDEYNQLKKKHEKNNKNHGSKKLLKVLFTFIIIGLIFVLYVYNPKFNKAVNNTFNKITSAFDNKDSNEKATEEPTTIAP